MIALVLLVIAGCCGRGEPVWLPLDPLLVNEGSASIDLAAFLIDDKGEHTFTVDADPQLIAEIDGSILTVTPQPDFTGTALVTLTAEDRCGNRATTEVEATTIVPTTDVPASCATTLVYETAGSPSAVAVAGGFNDWSPTADPMVREGSRWTVTLDLPPGPHPYKIVETTGGTAAWTCDPGADYIQCDPGYKQPSEIGFAHECTPGAASCNSMLIVGACDAPVITATRLDIDRAAGTVQLEAAIDPPGTPEVLLDGAAVDAVASDTSVAVALTLSPGRHTLRVRVPGAEDLYVPVWIDDRSWSDQVLYFAFIDRVSDGDPDLGLPQGATAIGGDYEGGDLRGLVDLLPYLDDLGVTALWVSNLQGNAKGTWEGSCGLTYTGYHAYWPDDARAVEEHFGDPDLVRELVDGAHARGIRVVMDLVANHVHQDHPYFRDHPEWFGEFEACNASVDGQLNFDRIPETCWFSPYLPDFDYTKPEPLAQLVDDAMYWASTYELDGFRVDAVKHMSHAVAWDLAGLVRERIEHTSAGGDEDFLLVGETFDGAERIASYIGPDQLDGQFDFPLYYALRNTFAYGNGELYDVLAAYEGSRAVFGDATMSTFLGNHDVNRFTTDAERGWQDPCDGAAIRIADPPTAAFPYERLKLAWTFLFTMPGIPLVYYGDELGFPGNPDPDNRQPMSWHAGDLGGVDSVEALAGRVSAEQASVARHVRALAHAREAHPALRSGGWVEWWREPDLLGYARSSGDDHALVLLNRSDTARTLSNGLAFAGLPQGRYVDVATGEPVTSTGDAIAVPVGAGGSRVLVWSP